MAFVFKLQQLLQIALHEENEVKNRLARKDGQIAELVQKIQKYIDDQDVAIKDQTIAVEAGNIMEAQMYPLYLNSLRKSQKFYENELALQQKQRQKIMEELMEKQRKRKTFEKMREAEEAKYKKEMLKKQQKQLDEFGSRKKPTLTEEIPENA